MQVAGLVPALKSFPVASWLGLPALTQWGWELAPSAGYIGQGMIMGPRTTASMLAGAVVGYGILGPVARRAGWAPGPIGDWETGAAGWVMWVSLAIMLTDALTSLGVLVAQQLRGVARPREGRDQENSPPACQVPVPWWGGGLAASAVVCVALLSPMFDLPLYQPAIALVLALLVAFVAVRCVPLRADSTIPFAVVYHTLVQTRNPTGPLVKPTSTQCRVWARSRSWCLALQSPRARSSPTWWRGRWQKRGLHRQGT